MTGHTFGVQLMIYGLVAMTCALGLPLFHYVTAVMVAVVLRHGRSPMGLLTPIFPARRTAVR